MNVYIVRATFEKHGQTPFAMLVHSPESKKAVAAALEARGWKVSRISVATLEDVTNVPSEAAVAEWIRKDLAERKMKEAEKEREAAEQARRAAVAARQERERRERKAEEDRDFVQSKAIGDILSYDLEPKLLGNQRLAAICAKVSLFFDQSGVNKREIFTAISIDFADFQSRTSFKQANRLIKQVVEELNEYLLLDAEIARLHDRLNEDRRSTENTLNSIASRTHVYGGSGGGLLLSMFIAEQGVKSDERQMDQVERQHREHIYKVKEAVQRIEIRKELLEYRAKTAVSVLLMACGKAETIELNIPIAVEQHFLGHAH